MKLNPKHLDLLLSNLLNRYQSPNIHVKKDLSSNDDEFLTETGFSNEYVKRMIDYILSENALFFNKYNYANAYTICITTPSQGNETSTFLFNGGFEKINTAIKALEQSDREEQLLERSLNIQTLQLSIRLIRDDLDRLQAKEWQRRLTMWLSIIATLFAVAQGLYYLFHWDHS